MKWQVFFIQPDLIALNPILQGKATHFMNLPSDDYRTALDMFKTMSKTVGNIAIDIAKPLKDGSLLPFPKNTPCLN